MILVTGATGRIGRLLVDTLVGEYGADVRAISRIPAGAHLPGGVDVVQGDPSRPATLAAAFADVTAVYLNPAAIGESAAELVALARESGVKRVVAQAAINIDDDADHQPSRFRGDRNREVEEAAVSSDLEWVSLRPSSFATNAARAWGAQIAVGDVVRGPYANFEEALIDPRDIADVAARALASDDLLGQRLELTGPESLSHSHQVSIIGNLIGRQLRYEEVPAEAAAQALIGRGAPEGFVLALMARYRRDLGAAQRITDGVEKALGRPPRMFEQWVSDHVTDFQADGPTP
jgi:uncharacterized protein YbjT (DUF2867 family)